MTPPTRSGFGTSVVGELIPYELGGAIDLMYVPKGVRCKMEIPAHWLSAGNGQGTLGRRSSGNCGGHAPWTATPRIAMRSADGLAGCTEGSEEEIELKAIVDLLED